MIDASFSSHRIAADHLRAGRHLQPYESAGWFQNVNRTDLSLARRQARRRTRTNVADSPLRPGPMTYVTGSAQHPGGVQPELGSQGFAYDANGDLRRSIKRPCPSP